ncbi:hypothetical protein BOSEA31B_12023 [Hyphomicrobiales bacterium]|nr:hypothetical protein BOSEA31B_12023 [Hyphomicrobiales bacterium]CAH1697802.1 hypothetical protein BOSEA1005_10847 [Hyphomicrobiales bacterium]CAI0347448.1 hypothetical protein BO1005MUT1_70229 [Hyphomicrobiales bacterium]
MMRGQVPSDFCGPHEPIMFQA